MLKTRVLAALVFTPAVLWVILLGGLTLRATCLGISQVLLWEYYRLILPTRDPYLKILGHSLAGLICLAIFSVLPHGAAALLVPASTLVLLLAVLLQPQPLTQSIQRAAFAALGVLWCGALLPYLAVLRARPHDGLGLSLIGLFCCWASDTGAYFAGRFCGKRPLCPAISPKKTLEGGLGGLVCSVAMALAVRAAMHVPVSLRHTAALGALGALAGILGDLSESLLKRSVGAKDSSNLLPGHGGFFDRFDGVVFAVPAVYIYVTLFVGDPHPL